MYRLDYYKIKIVKSILPFRIKNENLYYIKTITQNL